MTGDIYVLVFLSNWVKYFGYVMNKLLATLSKYVKINIYNVYKWVYYIK